MMKKQFLILLIIFWSENSSGFMTSLWKAANSAQRILTIITDPAFNAQNVTTISKLFSIKNSENQSIIDNLRYIGDHLERTYPVDTASVFFKIADVIPDDIKISVFWFEVGKNFDNLQKYARENASVHLLNDIYSAATVDIERELSIYQEKMYPTIRNESLGGGFFALLVKQELSEAADNCGINSSLQDSLMALFRTQVVGEMYATILIALAYWYRNFYSAADSEWKSKIEFLQARQKAQFTAYVNDLSDKLKKVHSVSHRACEQLHNWRTDETYSMLPLFEQKILVQTSWCGCRISNESFFAEKCQLRDYLTASMELPTSCEKLSEPVETCRRNQIPFQYEYVLSGNKGLQGRNIICPQDDVHTFQTTNLMFNAHKFRLCSCSFVNNNVRVYLGLMQSWKDSNYVIVGLRFRVTRYSKMIYLQPAQAKLEPNGITSDAAWLSLPDEESFNDDFQAALTLERRSFFLDDLQLPSGYVLTSIKFNAVKRSEILGFSIEIRGVPFDYETGQLDLVPRNQVTVKPSESGPERELEYIAANPLFSNLNELNRVSQGYSYVKLRQTDLNTDFGQTTVPIFNNIDVLTSRSSPLSGIGIFHRGNIRHAGFIAPSIYPVDFSRYVNNFTEMFEF